METDIAHRPWPIARFMMSDLNAILNDVWTKVRRKHLFPQLPPPILDDGNGRVAMDVRARQIRLSRGFVTQMASAMAPERIVEALLDHGIAHHLYCPWDLVTHLQLYARARKVLPDRAMARTAADMFMDIAADTRCVSQGSTPLAELYRQIPGGTLWDIQRAVCQRLWQTDLGVTDHGDIAGHLGLLAYLDRGSWPKAVKRFAALIKPYLEQNAEPADPPLGRNALTGYGPDQIDHGLRELAAQVSGPQEFKDVIEGFAEELAEAADRPGQGAGLGPGTLDQADVLYYMKLAQNHRLPVTYQWCDGGGGAYPHHHRPWEVGHPYRDIDPWTSLGKVLPGITQTWHHDHAGVFGAKAQIPDCLVLIDSSSSMVNPRHNLSHAVLGAGCACDAYLRRGARVGVYNFGDATAGASFALPLGKDRRAAFAALCRYHGGGTRLGVDQVRALTAGGPLDLFLITDMQITNLAELLDYFNACPHRATIVHLGENDQVRRLRRCVHPRAGLALFAVTKAQDIAGIILGQVRGRDNAARCL